MSLSLLNALVMAACLLNVSAKYWIHHGQKSLCRSVVGGINEFFLCIFGGLGISISNFPYHTSILLLDVIFLDEESPGRSIRQKKFWGVYLIAWVYVPDPATYAGQPWLPQ
jgi:branched-subunit amino acid ABC-type transport system permease component